MLQENPTISVVILTKNEEKNIEDCLKSCIGLGEVIVIDSFSTDRTVEIAKSHDVAVYRHEFINFREQREYGVHYAQGDWIFFLDADERVSPSLKEELIRFSQQREYSLLEIPRRNHLLGHWIRHCGWYPDYQARFLRKKELRFNPNIVHEKMETTGRATRLPALSDAYIIHYTCQSLESYFQKINHYTTLEAEQLYKTNLLKITRWAIFTRSVGMFTQTLFHHKGLKDGLPGFTVATFNLIYSFLLMLKIWEKRQQKK